MTNERQAALDAVLKAHMKRAWNQGWLPEDSYFWQQGTPQRECAQYLADNPGELERIRAEIEAEREPQHAFPDDDADLEGEMFDEGDGEAMTVMCRSHQIGVEHFYCRGSDGGWDWRTASQIRACKPLGPSPRKRIEQARKRVCEAARAWLAHPYWHGTEAEKLTARIESTLADLEALEVGEGAV